MIPVPSGARVNGETAERRLAVRREQSAPLLADLEDWMRAERAGLSRHSPSPRPWTIC